MAGISHSKQQDKSEYTEQQNFGFEKLGSGIVMGWVTEDGIALILC